MGVCVPHPVRNGMMFCLGIKTFSGGGATEELRLHGPGSQFPSLPRVLFEPGGPIQKTFLCLGPLPAPPPLPPTIHYRTMVGRPAFVRGVRPVNLGLGWGGTFWG